MVHVINFSESLEHELKELGAEVAEKQDAAPETAPVPERTLVRESIRSLAERAEVPPAAAEGAPLPASVPTSPPATDSPLPAYLDSPTVEPEVKREVEELIGMTFTAGLAKALGAAKRRPPFIEDAFHDALVEKLIPELKRRGLLR